MVAIGTIGTGSGGDSGPSSQLHETGDPQDLDIAAIPDGTFLKRVGTDVVGATPAGAGDVSGPGAAVISGDIVTWDGVTGTLIEDSGVAVTAIATAQSTANTAQSDASDAQLDADNAQTSADNAQADVDTHIGDTSNPHATVADQIGDGADLAIAQVPVNYSAAVPVLGEHLTGLDTAVGTAQTTADDAQTDATQALSDAATATSDAATAQSDIDTHELDTSNPHSTTAAQVGSPTLAIFNDHDARHLSGGADALTGNLDANARLAVRKNTGAVVGTRRRVNLIEGPNVTLTVADDGVDEEVDVTISASAAAALTASAPVDVTKAAASVGVATDAARADHKHDVTTAAAGTLAVGDVAAEGSATSLARADHTHALTAPAAPADVTKAAASAGVATTVARSDHKHDVSTAAPSTVGTANTEGSSTSLARADHVHNHGNLLGGALHALATDALAGFQSPDQFSLLRDSIGDAWATGLAVTANSPADQAVDVASGTFYVASVLYTHAGTSNFDLSADFTALTAGQRQIAKVYIDATNVVQRILGAVVSGSNKALAATTPAGGVCLAAVLLDKNVNNVPAAHITDCRSESSINVNVIDEAAKVSSNDTVSGYLDGKLVAGTGITLTQLNDGGNETLEISSSAAALTSTAPVDVTKAAAAVGVGTTAARHDHKHDVTTAAPSATGVATASAEGVATTLARSDHGHQSNTAPVNVTKAAAAIGTSGEPARADHKHDVTTATAASAGASNAEGSSTSLARADHTHAVVDLAISGQVQGDILYFNGTNWVRLAPGTSGQFLRTNGAAANPNWQTGSGTDPTHSEVNATGDITTGSATDVVVTSMTLTPGTGTYLVQYSCMCEHDTNNATATVSLYANGTQVANSERIFRRGTGNSRAGVPLQARVTVAAAQAIDVRWRTSTSTATMGNRSLSLLKVT